MKTDLAPRVLSAVAAAVWNSLPANIHLSVSTFKRLLEEILYYQLALPDNKRLCISGLHDAK